MQPAEGPKRQFRAFWLASVSTVFDWPSRRGLSADELKAEYRAWVDYAKRQNFNAVVVQIRPTADAFWPSPYEPWSEFLTGVQGKDPGWDPLAFLVEEAHARQLEFHAWFNPYRITMPPPYGVGPDVNALSPDHPARKHPEWVVAYPVNAAGSRLYYNPGIPEVRRFVEDAILDAVARYDVDAVHFDDYFYPYPVAGQDFGDDATFAQYGATFANKGDWRRDNVNQLVREMKERLRALKPWVKFGISPFGIWRNQTTDPMGSSTAGTQSYDAIAADTRRWVKEGWIDYVVPQVYWNIGFAVADYAKLVPWWADLVSGTHVHLYVGHANYKIGSSGAWLEADELSRQLELNRTYPQVAGDVHFSANDLRADRLGAVSRALAAHYARPALVPRMPHLAAEPVTPPDDVTVERDPATGAVTLRAGGAPQAACALGQRCGFAVYRVDDDAMSAACELLGSARSGQPFVDSTAQPGRRYTYFVTGLDRLWNESDFGRPQHVR